MLKKELCELKSNNNHTCNKLKDENEFLKTVNLSLEKQIKLLKANISQVDVGLSLTNLDTTQLKVASEKNIDKYITNILENKDMNITWLPDAVERKIYKNIMNLVISAVESTMESSSVRFLGHDMKFVIYPVFD